MFLRGLPGGAAGIDPQYCPEHQQLQRQMREAQKEMLVDEMLRDEPWISQQEYWRLQQLEQEHQGLQQQPWSGWTPPRHWVQLPQQ